MGARQPEAHAAPDQRLTSSVWTTSPTTDRGNYTYSSSRLTRGHSSCAVGCAARRDVSHGACVACACGPSGCVVQKWRVGTWDTVGVGGGRECLSHQPTFASRPERRPARDRVPADSAADHHRLQLWRRNTVDTSTSRERIGRGAGGRLASSPV